MYKKRKEFLNHRFKRLLKIDIRYQDLNKKLLSIGGEIVVPMPEPHLEEILNRGQIYKDKNSIHYEKGLRTYPSECHINISYDYVRFCGKDFKIITGWALSSDGYWRQHTWGLWKGHIIESTVSRMLYFGYELNSEESVQFVFSNALNILNGKEIKLIKKAKVFNKLVGDIITNVKRKDKIK